MISNKLRDIVRNCYKALEKRDAKFTSKNYGLRLLSDKLMSITKSSVNWQSIGYNGEPDSIGLSYRKSKSLYDEYQNKTITSLKNAFQNKDIGYLPKVKGQDSSSVTDAYQMCNGCTMLCSIADDWNFEGMTNIERAFYQCTSLTSFNFKLIAVTNIKSMFYACSLLYSLSKTNEWDLTKVTSMESTFAMCQSLETINASNWRLNSCTSMKNAFQSTKIRTIDCEHWFDNNNVCSDFYGVFSSCKMLESTKENPIKLTNWIKCSNTNVSMMFNTCQSSNFKFLDLSSWDTSLITNWNSAFNRCSNLQEIRGEGGDDNDCGYLDFSNVNTGKSTSAGATYQIFSYCSLKKVKIKNLHVDIELPNTLDYECLAYIINNATSSTSNPITITFLQWNSKHKALFGQTYSAELTTAANKGITITG